MSPKDLFIQKFQQKSVMSSDEDTDTPKSPASDNCPTKRKNTIDFSGKPHSSGTISISSSISSDESSPLNGSSLGTVSEDDEEEEEEDDWRNDFLSPGSAMSKGHSRDIPSHVPTKSFTFNERTRSLSPPPPKNPRGHSRSFSTDAASIATPPPKNPRGHSRSFSTDAASTSMWTMAPPRPSTERSNSGSSTPLNDDSHPLTRKPQPRDRSMTSVGETAYTSLNDDSHPLTRKPQPRDQSMTSVGATVSKGHRRVNTISSHSTTLRKPNHRRSSSMSSSLLQTKQGFNHSTRGHSLDTLEAELERLKHKYGENHFRVGHILNLIGNCYLHRQAQHELAIAYYKKSLLCEEGYKIPGRPEHIAAAYRNIGTACWYTGDLNMSIANLTKSLEVSWTSEILRKQDPETSLDVATSYYLLGMAHSVENNYEQALARLHQALLIQERALGRVSMEVARTMDAIGKAYLNCGQADEAAMCHQEAYATKCKIMQGHDSSSAIVTLNNLVAAHVAREDYNKAISTVLIIQRSKSDELAVARDQGRKDENLVMEVAEIHLALTELYIKTSAFQNAKWAAMDAISLYGEGGLSDKHPTVRCLKQRLQELNTLY